MSHRIPRGRARRERDRGDVRNANDAAGVGDSAVPDAGRVSHREGVRP
jgi:hypothetical protein